MSKEAFGTNPATSEEAMKGRTIHRLRCIEIAGKRFPILVGAELRLEVEKFLALRQAEGEEAFHIALGARDLLASRRRVHAVGDEPCGDALEMPGPISFRTCSMGDAMDGL